MVNLPLHLLLETEHSSISMEATLLEGLTAVSIISLSVSSHFPPGKAVCPGCDRSSFERVVRST